MKALLQGLGLVTAVAVCSPGMAVGPSSQSYAMPSSVLNAGIGPAAGAGHDIASSLGGPVATATVGAASARLHAGFQTAAYQLSAACLLDVDGNGSIDALTDGLMILRAMFGLTGTSVTNNAIGTGALRATWADIQPMIRMHALDIDGNGTTDALTDGLLVMRALFGLTGASVTNGAVAPGASRTTWADVRTFLNASCGTSLAP